MYVYETILKQLERTVPRLFSRQITDPAHPARGAFISADPGCPSPTHTGHAHDLACACYAFLADESAFRGDPDLLERIGSGIDFQKHWQRPSGLVDGIVSNWNSPNATAFTVQLLAPVVEIARRRAAEGDERAVRIADDLGEYIRTAAQAIVGRGFHTPNHRWIICSALAQAMSLFPDVPVLDYLESILAEGVDIDADGQFSERSPGIYSAACDRSLRFMADYLERPELLEPVRRNLDLIAHLFHPDWTVETAMSGRRDRNRRLMPFGIADSFFDMAQRDRNGVWASIADQLADRASADPPFVWLFHPFIAHPEYRNDSLERLPPPDHYDRIFPTSRIWRVRRGSLSATAIGGKSTLFSARYGDLILKAVQVGETFNNTSAFETDTFETIDGGVRLVHRGNPSRQRQFDLPLGRPVPFDTFYAARDDRDHLALPPFDIALEIRTAPSGFDLHLRTVDAMERVTFQIECCFAGPGEWETDGTVIQVDDGQTAILKQGYGIFHRGYRGIRIGPGASAHRMWQMRGTEPHPDSFRVLIPLQTPVDHRLEIRFGSWSAATGGLLED